MPVIYNKPIGYVKSKSYDNGHYFHLLTIIPKTFDAFSPGFITIRILNGFFQNQHQAFAEVFISITVSSTALLTALNSDSDFCLYSKRGGNGVLHLYAEIYGGNASGDIAYYVMQNSTDAVFDMEFTQMNELPEGTTQLTLIE